MERPDEAFPKNPGSDGNVDDDFFLGGLLFGPDGNQVAAAHPSDPAGNVEEANAWEDELAPVSLVTVHHQVRQPVGAAEEPRLPVVVEPFLGLLDGRLDGQGRGAVGGVGFQAVLQLLQRLLLPLRERLRVLAQRQPRDVGMRLRRYRHWSRRHDGCQSQSCVSLVGGDRMRVTWITKQDVPSMVEYGKSPGEYTSAFGEIASSYTYLFYRSGYIHNVVIGPLEANTVYYYRCGGHGPEYNLKTPPSQLPIVFSIVGDLGQTGWTKSTLQHIQDSYHDVFLLPGDLSYADNNQPLWDSFGRLVEPLASSRPWMVTEGNHETETILILMDHAFRSYNARWQMPYNESGSTSNLYYSFEVAGVHVVMLGSYADYGTDSDQYRWLKGDLGGVNRVRTPWLFVLLHAPWYNTNIAHQGEGEKMRKAMEPLLYAANVDIVFAGHVHSYERFTRVYNNKADPCGPIYITIGDGGNREGLALEFKKPQSELSLFREASFGHGELGIYNATHTHWSWHRNQDDESVVSDEIWITSLGTSSNSCQKLQESPTVNGRYSDEL